MRRQRRSLVGRSRAGIRDACPVSGRFFGSLQNTGLERPELPKTSLERR